MAKSKIISTVTSSDLYTLADLEIIRDYPEILGHLASYDKLKRLHGEWIKYLFIKDGDKVRSLWAHRGSYKSTALSVGIVWRWLWFPEDTVLLCRKSFSEAAAVVGDVCKIMKLPEIRELFRFAHGEYPEITREKIGDAVVDFSFRKKPSIAPSLTGVGSTSQLTGRHTSIVLVDDLSTLRSRTSKAERNSDQATYRELVTNIQNRGDADTGFTRVIGTPWCQPGSGGIEDLIPAPKKYSIEETGLISPDQLDEIKRSTTFQLFACNYLLEFVSGDMAVFRNPEYGDWDFVNCETPRASIDFAYSKEGDHTALCIGARLRTGKIQMVGFLFKGNGFDWLPRIHEILKLYKCKKVFVETNRDASWGATKLRELGLSVRDYNESMKKNIKIATYGLEVWNDVIWSRDTDPEFMNQILDWVDESGNNADDAPDSYASLVRGAYSRKTSNSARWEF